MLPVTTVYKTEEQRGEHTDGLMKCFSLISGPLHVSCRCDTHALSILLWSAPLCSTRSTFHSVCVLSVLTCTPAETQQTYLDTFFFPWRWPLYSTSGPTEAVLFKTMLCWSKRAIFNVSLREVFCFWRGGGVCLCELFSLSPLTFINPTCSSCCTQLYYQSNGHVVHCKILYIESILLNVF